MELRMVIVIKKSPFSRGLCGEYRPDGGRSDNLLTASVASNQLSWPSNSSFNVFRLKLTREY